MIDWYSILQPILTSLLTAFLGGLLIFYVKSRGEKKKANRQLSRIDSYEKIAKDEISKLVEELNITLVNQIKIASDDGTLSDDEVAKISQIAKAKLYAKLDGDVLDAMKTTYGNIDSLFDSWISIAADTSKLSSGGSGIESTVALGLAQAQNMASNERAKIRGQLDERLNTLADNTTLA